MQKHGRPPQNESPYPNSAKLQQLSHRLIPGGAHTYAKGDDQYPQLAPGFIVRGKGSHVWDVDGNEYIEYGSGLRAVGLGHAFDAVDQAVVAELAKGINFCRPNPIEVRCAEALLDLIPGAEMAKFSKNGSDATTAAVKLARACTGRDMIAYCADHPFFSTDDWFIGTTQNDAGIPDDAKRLSAPFRYNDLASLEAVFAQHPDRIACVVMEPEKETPPKNGFLGQVRYLTHSRGALLIFDEIITGFRHHLGGAQTKYGVTPDLSAFGKAMGNGYSIAALVGKAEYMQRGGLDHDAERVFLLSTTFGAESHHLAAALATMDVYQKEGVVDVLHAQGAKLRDGVVEAANDLGLSDYFGVAGLPASLIFFTRDADGERSQAMRALFMQEMIKRGVLAPSFVIGFSHTDEDIKRTVDAVRGSLEVYGRALADGVEQYLVGRPVAPVNRRYNDPSKKR